jgi:hypothetical protein
MLEKVQEELYQKIKEGLIDKTNIEIPFKYILQTWFPNQKISEKNFTRALLDFNYRYNLDNVIILEGNNPIIIRFWWKKYIIGEN